MSLTTITIDTNSYQSYATVAEADVYLAADVDLYADWAALDNDAKSRRLVSATRRLDTLRWIGAPTDAMQTTAWPRTGIEGVADDAIPTNLEYACILLAGDSSIALGQTRTGSDSNANAGAVSSVRVGDLHTSYFYPDGNRRSTFQTAAPRDAEIVPDDILSLISQWIVQAKSTISGGRRFGAKSQSAFGDGQDRSRGFY